MSLAEPSPTGTPTPAERLASIALEVGLQLPESPGPLEMLDRILDHIEQHPSLLLKGLAAVSSSLNLNIPDGPVSVEELGRIRRVLGLWDVLPAYLPPLQPLNWSNRFLNTHYAGAMGAHNRIQLYFQKARQRLGTEFAYGQMQHEAGHYLQLDCRREAAAVLADLIKRVRLWLENGQCYWRPDLHADIIELELHYFRSNNAMFQEVKGTAFEFDRDELYFVLEQIVPRIGPYMPWAAAEALNLLNIVVLGPLVQQFAEDIGDVAAIGPDSVGLVAASLELESIICRGLKHEARSMAAASCHIWISSLYSNFPPDQVLKGTTPEQAAGLTITDLQRKALECPLFGLEILDAIVRMNFSSHPVWNAMNVSPESVFEALNAIVSPLAANPSALPYRVRYRPVIRAILSAEPPVLEWTSFLCRSKKEPEALATWHAEWMRTRCRLKRVADPLSTGSHNSFEEWRKSVSDRAKEVVLTLEEDRVMEEMSLEEFAKRLVDMPGYTYATAQKPAEMLLDRLKEDFPLYFAPSYPFAAAASIENSRRFVEATCSGLRDRDVDLLVITFANVGISILHYRSDKREWKSANGLPDISRTTLGMLSVYAGRPAGEGDDAGWGSPGLPAGMSPQKLMSHIADLIVLFAFQHHEIRSRNCLIVAPDLEGVPLTCSFASRLHAEFGDNAQLGELTGTGGVEAFGRATAGGRFAGFKDPLLEDEIIWGTLGLSGSVNQRFSPDDLLFALESDHNIVHVVTHGVLDHLAPVFSFVIADRSPLFSFDLFGRNFQTKLVILNTCSSGSGGAFGAASGFSPLRMTLEAGVEVGIGNLFPVETELAARFAITFQNALAQSRLSCAAAFCRAIAAAKPSSGDLPSFIMVGRSIESMFAEDWSQAILKTA